MPERDPAPYLTKPGPNLAQNHTTYASGGGGGVVEGHAGCATAVAEEAVVEEHAWGWSSGVHVGDADPAAPLGAGNPSKMSKKECKKAGDGPKPSHQSSRPPNPTSSCAACRGRHRPHTCGKVFPTQSIKKAGCAACRGRHRAHTCGRH